jgi:DNA-binding CsgD family transcriptional regulator
VRESGTQHSPAEGRQVGDDLIRCRSNDQQEQRRAVGIELLTKLAHEAVVDADIGERPGERSGRGPERSAENRRHEQRTDQQPPETTADGPGGGQVMGLAQRDPARRRLADHRRVLEVDEVRSLGLAKREQDLVGAVAIGIGDDDELAHGLAIVAAPRHARGRLPRAATNLVVFARVTRTPDSETPAREAGDRVPCLEVLEGRKKGRVFPLERTRAYVIGRLPGAEIHIDDPGVSRRHVKLTRRPDGSIDVADMRSTNGLVVNGQKLERAVLRDGDLMSLGPDAVLRLSYRRSDDLEAAPIVEEPEPEHGASAALGESRERTEATLSGEETSVMVVQRAKLADLPLSARQLEVSRLVANGLTNAAIAETLGISPRTVTSHLDHIYGRLGIGSRAALTRWIVERGLVDPLE